jgi:hypothetical protein
VHLRPSRERNQALVLRANAAALLSFPDHGDEHFISFFRCFEECRVDFVVGNQIAKHDLQVMGVRHAEIHISDAGSRRTISKASFMGDMLVKAGDWETARKIYSDAKLSPTYAEWQYREVLEDRIRDAPDNVAAFNAPADATNRGDKQIMVATAFACMACHRQ